MPKREISREEFEQAFRENPGIRHNDLKKRFKAGSETIARELKRHGFKTLDSSQREKPWLQGDKHPLRKWHRDNPDFGSRQRGLSNPVHKVKHLYDDPSYVDKLTRGLRAHSEFKLGRTYEDVYGEEKAREYKDKLRKATPARMAKYLRKRTGLEKTVESMLISLGIRLQSEVGMGSYVVDFLLPDFGVVVQADGDYWHANPTVYLEADLTNRQRTRRRLDRSCDSFLGGLGYRVLRLWENDIKNRPEWCKDEIRKATYGKEV